MDLTVVVATFGPQAWADLAMWRALPSASAQGAVTIHTHAGSLHDARNTALSHVDTEYVVHLDADDELEPGYLDAMRAASGDVRVPMVRYVPGHGPAFPKVVGHAHDCQPECLRDGNWVVVGACVRTELVRQVGGWRPWPIYEDWCLWQRCWQAGATFERVPEAIYRAHVQSRSRNHGPGRRRWYRAIREANGL